MGEIEQFLADINIYGIGALARMSDGTFKRVDPTRVQLATGPVTWRQSLDQEALLHWHAGTDMVRVSASEAQAQSVYEAAHKAVAGGGLVQFDDVLASQRRVGRTEAASYDSVAESFIKTAAADVLFSVKEHKDSKFRKLWNWLCEDKSFIEIERIKWEFRAGLAKVQWWLIFGVWIERENDDESFPGWSVNVHIGPLHFQYDRYTDGNDE